MLLSQPAECLGSESAVQTEMGVVRLSLWLLGQHDSQAEAGWVNKSPFLICGQEHGCRPWQLLPNKKTDTGHLLLPVLVFWIVTLDSLSHIFREACRELTKYPGSNSEKTGLT